MEEDRNATEKERPVKVMSITSKGGRRQGSVFIYKKFIRTVK